MSQNQKLIHLSDVYPDQKRQLFKYFRHHPMALEAFVATVDVSDYPLSDWLDALDIMTDWLTERGRVMSLNNKIQYLNCAQEIIDKGAHLNNMASAIHQILEQYGCERTNDETNKNN